MPRSRSRSLVLLFPVLLLSGCGGCDSCFGNASSTEDASPPTTTATARPASTGDAALTPDDAGSDAASSDAMASARDATAIPIPTVARPKQPPNMALGAFQTCGRYDGPLCEKSCPKGACRQECDAVRCDLTCAAGYCSQVCGAQGTCNLTCTGGHCTQLCVNPEGCIKDCAGGGCN